MSQTRWTLVLSGLLAAIAAIYLMVPALNLGFVSYDFVHLSSDRAMPWYYSSDALYRPLRNGLFKVMASFFGLKPQPYRILSLLVYLLCAFLFYRVLRALDLAFVPAGAATCLAFLTPRNHALLFWFAAIQDVLCVICVLGVILSWIHFRKRSDGRSLVISFCLYTVALGFKETAILAPVLVGLVDWFFLQPDASKTRMKNWAPYLGFLVPALLFSSFVYWYPQGLLRITTGTAPRFDFGLSDVAGAALAELRSFLNLILPFERPFGLRDIRLPLAAMSAIVMAVFGAIVLFSPNKTWLFAALWIVVTLLPMSLLARARNEEHDLFLAGLGLAAAISMSLNDFAKSRPRSVVYLLIAPLLLYCGAGVRRLKRHEEEWRVAANSVQQFIRATEAVLPQTGATYVVDFINVPHSINGKPSLNNGLRGALISGGYSSKLTLNATHDGDPADLEQQELITTVRACSMTEPQNDHRVLLVTNVVVTDHTSPCARAAVAADLRLRPWAWSTEPRN